MRREDTAAIGHSTMLAAALIFLAGFSLQSGMFLIGPLLSDISGDLGLSGIAAGALTGIPPLMMGLFAIPGGRLTGQLSAWRLVGVGLIAIGSTGALRGLVPSAWLLFAATLAFGSAIGLTQPAGPTYIRARFPDRIGSMTSVYTFGLVSGVIVASGLAGPVLAPIARGWRGALICWGVLGILTGAVWLRAAFKPASVAAERAQASAAVDSWSPWRSREVWLASALYAGQGIVFFLLGSWLPAIHSDAGFSRQASGLRMLVLAAASLPAVIIFPRWADRAESLRLPFAGAAAITLTGTLGYFFVPVSAPADLLWALLTGFGVGGILALALAFAAETGPETQTSATAAMVLAVGYSVTALGPLVGGIVTDLAGDRRSALMLPPIVAAVMLLIAFALPAGAGRAGNANQRIAAPDRAPRR
jgi:CP family cyanate transporter-like MFS transporter